MIRFWICPEKRKILFLNSEIRIWIFPNKTHLWFNVYWLNLNRDVILLKRWFLRKEVVTDIVVQRVYLPKKLRDGGWGGGRGGEIPKYNGHHRQGLEGCLRIHDLTRNMVRDSA